MTRNRIPTHMIEENGRKLSDVLAEKAKQNDLTNIANVDDFFTSGDILLMPSYGGFIGTSAIGNLELYVSNDLKMAYNVNLQKIYTPKVNRPLWDNYLCFYNNEFLMISDYKDIVYDTWGGNTFNFAATSDFKTYREWQIKFPSPLTQLWAPKLCIDGNKTFMIFCAQTNSETYIRPNDNVSDQKLQVYFSTPISSDLTSWNAPIKIQLPSPYMDYSMIDPCLVKGDDGYYHLFIKLDYKQQIYHFKCLVMDGTTTWTLVNAINTNDFCEAPAVFKFNGKWRLLTDAKILGNVIGGQYLVQTSDDLVTWDYGYVLNNYANDTMRHFFPLILNQDSQKQVIKNLMMSEQKGATAIYTNSIKRKLVNPNQKKLYRTPLDIYADTNGVIASLPVQANRVYFVDKTRPYNNLVVNSLDTSQLLPNDTFYFAVFNSTYNQTITLKYNVNSKTFFPFSTDYPIGKMWGNHELLVPFIFSQNEVRAHFPYYLKNDQVGKNQITDVFASYVAQNGTISQSNVSMIGGLTSVEINNSGQTVNKWTGARQDLTYMPTQGDIYTLSAYYLIDDISTFDSGIGLELKGRTSGGDITLGSLQIPLSSLVSGVWQRIVNTFTIPSVSGVTSVYAYFWVQKNGRMWWQKVKLEKGSICTNY